MFVLKTEGQVKINFVGNNSTNAVNVTIYNFNILSEVKHLHKCLFIQIEQDFVLIFGEKTSSKLLERWPTTFMHKVIQQSKSLNSSQALQDLIDCAEMAVNENEMGDTG